MLSSNYISNRNNYIATTFYAVLADRMRAEIPEGTLLLDLNNKREPTFVLRFPIVRGCANADIELDINIRTLEDLYSQGHDESVIKKTIELIVSSFFNESRFTLAA